MFTYNKSNKNVTVNDKVLHIDRLATFSIKYYNLLNLIKNSNGPIFINTRRVHIGVKIIAMILEENGMERYKESNFLSRHSKDGIFKNNEKNQYIYIDGITENKVNEYVTHFNQNKQNKIKVILGTDAIAVGINLFRIREVHILEPWFNLNKTDQVIGELLVKFHTKC